MIPIKRKRIDATAEMNLVTGCIVSTRLCREMLPVLKNEYLQGDYCKVVVNWVRDYFQKYDKAPEEDITNLFLTEGEKLESSIRDTTEEFLKELSKKYEAQETFNEEYLIDQSLEYIKKRALKLHSDKITAFVELDEVEEAEREVTSYRTVARMTSSWVNPFEPEYIEQTLLKDEDHLMELPGVLGEVLGPLERGWLISLLGPIKRGKSWWLGEFRNAALMERLKVAEISLEMDDEEVSSRTYKQMTGLPNPKYKYIIYPIFDCQRNQEGSCKDENRPEQEPLLINKVKPRFNTDMTHKVCIYCRGKDPKRYISAVWYTMEVRKPIALGRVKKRIRIFSKLYGKDNWRLISHPIRTANVGDIKRDLELLEYTEDFIPDVIIIDYADILKPEDSRVIGRDAINETWQELRSMAQQRSCLVVTVTQSNRDSFDRKYVKATNTSEDIRKLAHVNLMCVLNQTPVEKREGIMRFGIIAHRHEDFDEMTQVQILQQLKIGQPYLDAEILRSLGDKEEEEEGI